MIFELPTKLECIELSAGTWRKGVNLLIDSDQGRKMKLKLNRNLTQACDI